MEAAAQTSPTESEPKRSRASVPWGPVAAVLVTIGIYFASQILGGIIISIYPVLRGWNEAEAAQWLEQSVYAQFAFVCAVEALTIWLLWQFLKRRKGTFAQLGLRWPKAVDVAYALTGFALYFIAYIGTISLVQQYAPGVDLDQKQELGFSTDQSGIGLLVVFISLVILPPVVEEIVTRGFLYTGLRKKLPVLTAGLITSVLFAAAHLQWGSGDGLLWIAAIDTFVLSFVLVYLREKTGRLWAPIALHMLKNGIAFTSLFVLKLA